MNHQQAGLEINGINRVDDGAIDSGLASAAKLSKKLESRGAGARVKPDVIHPSEYIEPTNPYARKRGSRRPKLTTQDKIQIVHKILYQHHSVKEVAKEFRISQPYASILATKAKRKPGFLAELAAIDRSRLDFKEKVAIEVDQYN